MRHFEIKKIIKLVYAQYPSQQRMDVIRALKACSEGWWVSDNYISYYHPLKHGEYQFKERITLKDEELNLQIDLLLDEIIGGIEFENDERSN
jgi:hypothetical protein